MTQSGEQARKTIRRLVGVAALALWVSSLFLPVARYCTAYNGSLHLSGLTVLAMGWMGWADGQFGWFANPLILWVIIRLLCGFRAGAIAASIAFVLALLSFSFNRTADDTGFQQLCGKELGFYLWFAAAMLLMAMAVRERLWREADAKRAA
ncbi:MAG: hypothetical protein AB1508_01015 [Pseudomonadota bacterium]